MNKKEKILELIEKNTPYPMTEQELADAERRLYRFFQLLYEIQLECEVKNVK